MTPLSKAKPGRKKKEVVKPVEEIKLLGPALIVEDKRNRGLLGEGRNYQMGFALCKNLGNDKFETVQPLSPCKDYLNDVLYSEHTGLSFSACGLNTKKEGIFEGQDKGYLAIKLLTTNGGNGYYTGNLEADRATLKKNHNNIIRVLNYMEESLGVVGRSSIRIASNDQELYLLEMPLFWCQSSHLISLYSLAVRVSQFWDGEGTPDDYMASYDHTLDISLWPQAYFKYRKMLRKGVEVKPFNKANVHNNGILQY